MTPVSRRSFLAGTGLAATTALTGCANRVASSRGEIDARSDAAIAEMYQSIPGSQALASRAAGVLIMPRINEANFFGGGAYGEGALLIQNAKVDYYALVGASLGLQIGAQRYKHALFFMTPEALAGFRSSDGWELGADAEYVVADRAGAVTVTTSTFQKPIYALIFGQEGIAIGASIEGNKYSRIVR